MKYINLSLKEFKNGFFDKYFDGLIKKLSKKKGPFWGVSDVINLKEKINMTLEIYFEAILKEKGKVTKKYAEEAYFLMVEYDFKKRRSGIIRFFFIVL